jgi:hypothetical protein
MPASTPNPATHCVCPGCGRVAHRRRFPRGIYKCGYEAHPRCDTVAEMMLSEDPVRYADVRMGPFLRGVLQVLGK